MVGPQFVRMQITVILDEIRKSLWHDPGLRSETISRLVQLERFMDDRLHTEATSIQTNEAERTPSVDEPR